MCIPPPRVISEGRPPLPFVIVGDEAFPLMNIVKAAVYLHNFIIYYDQNSYYITSTLVDEKKVQSHQDHGETVHQY
ncbi:hypothetical protein NQ315_011291 [Exocentrus adspersus]|uniref:Protein ALP1-like n=1 Tax=Exocentrus adspersus TaxID=1586481 RepID=A0AAV8VJE1_9CUCU|nr:hypothetical protein NQ315_011291 [Exocentrus adspersus]